MKISFMRGLLAVVLIVSAANLFAQNTSFKNLKWTPAKATLLAKSSVILVEYNADDKKINTHKYKLFDIALGKVTIETSGRDYYGFGNRFVIMDDYMVNVYDINATKPTAVMTFKVSGIAGKPVEDIEIVGLSAKGNPIFRQTGSAEPAYYMYSMATKAIKKLGTPNELYKSTFIPQTGQFDYLKEADKKHMCYSYNPETEEVKKVGTIDSINSSNIYRIQTSPNNKFVIYGGSQVYNLDQGNVMYTLPLSSGNMSWNGNTMDYTGQRVSTTFSAKGDSVIVIKKMKDSMVSDEKVQVEIYSTVNKGSVKSFFMYEKGSLLIDTDISSGWAVFLGGEKIKVMHLTTKKIVREFSVANTPETPFGISNVTTGSAN